MSEPKKPNDSEETYEKSEDIDNKEDIKDGKEDIVDEGNEEVDSSKNDGEEDEGQKIEDEEVEDKVEDEEVKDKDLKKSKKKQSSKVFKILLLLLLLGIGTVSAFFIKEMNKILEDPAIYENVKIEGIDVGGLEKKEALEKIKSIKEKEIDQMNMELSYGEKIYNLNVRELGYKLDYDKAVEQAYNMAREGKKLDRLKEIKEIEENGREFKLESSFDKSKAGPIAEEIRNEINLEKKEASFNFNGGNIQVSDHQVGRQVDEEKLIELINDNVYKLEPIEIPVEMIYPNRTKEKLSRINGVIGQFKTSFPTSTPGRKENIRISAQSLSKDIVMPGESLSFNQSTGPRSVSNGYKDAVVIMDGDYTDGVGGGVCQTSTTLYNALLLADLTIVRRSPHSIPAKYVPYGQDAAVAYDYIDLVFRNDFDFPVYINSIFTGNDLIIQVYGDRNAKDYEVKIEAETVDTISPKVEKVVDNSLAPGTKELVQGGRTGYKVNTYKSIIKNGKIVKRDLITQDYYKERNTIYRVGP